MDAISFEQGKDRIEEVSSMVLMSRVVAVMVSSSASAAQLLVSIGGGPTCLVVTDSVHVMQGIASLENERNQRSARPAGSLPGRPWGLVTDNTVCSWFAPQMMSSLVGKRTSAPFLEFTDSLN